MPALGGYNPRSPFGDLRGTKPKVPQLFFTLAEEEIVALLVSQGFSERIAKQEAAEFMRYKEAIVGPKQVFSDDDDQAGKQGQPQPEATHRKFADEVAQKEGE